MQRFKIILYKNNIVLLWQKRLKCFCGTRKVLKQNIDQSIFCLSHNCRTNRLAFCKMSVMTMTDLWAAVTMEIYMKITLVDDLIGDQKILKFLKKSFLTLLCWKALSFMLN